MNKFKLYLAIALLSAAIISFQLALIQILSNVQWHHLAHMVISMALLGFGAAGTVLSIFRNRIIAHTETLLPFLMTATGIAMSLVTDISQTSLLRFDSYLLFAEYDHIGKLLLTYLIYFLPFFFGALAIGLVFMRHVAEIGKIYFSNLVGSGVGGLITLLLISFFFPKQVPALIAMLPLIGGFMIIPSGKRFWNIAFALVGVVVIGWKCFYPPKLELSQYKDLSKTLLLPNSKIILEKASPYGVVQMVSSPALRYAPGMSLSAQQASQIKMAAFLNGDWFGAVSDWKKSDTAMILDYTTFALPYIMKKRNSVLVLQAGTGIEVAHAITRGAANVVAVESNPVILSILKKHFAIETDSLFFHPGVVVGNIESRTFLSLDDSYFDLVSLPMVGTFGGSAGLSALHEQFLLTRQALGEIWFKLEPEGVVSVTSWMDYPIRNPLKILATMVEVLEESGIKNPREHIAAVRSWGTITFVMKKSILQTIEVNNIRRFCEEMMFDPAILPHLDTEERSRYNQFQDDQFFSYVDSILAPRREAFYEDYDFNIKPATDNRPYFSQYIKWSSLDRLAQFFGNRSIPFFEIGYLLVIITLVQISIVSFILILLPLFRLRWKGRSRTGVILYFSGIGMGYMFVEMVLIQRFILYLGNTVYSASAVITSLLIFSGLGSYYSSFFLQSKTRLLAMFSFIIGLLVAYSFILTPILQETIHVSFFVKSLIILLTIAPLAFCMGIPFPAGLSQVSGRHPEVVPWAWGINGCVSVVSTALATIIAVEMGFMWVMLLAAVAYCMPLLVQRQWR